MSQVRSSKWIRNGQSLFALASLYRSSPSWSPISYMMDIHTIQFCSANLDWNYVLLSALDRFQCFNWFSLTSSTLNYVPSNPT